MKSQLAGVSTVDGFQALVKPRLDRVVEATSYFSYSGIEQLDTEASYLFISNHRDIVMDSAYANSVLVVEGHRTAQIAIGDNLLQKPWVSHLMRINKSFIVKRSLSGRSNSSQPPSSWPILCVRRLSKIRDHCGSRSGKVGQRME